LILDFRLPIATETNSKGTLAIHAKTAVPQASDQNCEHIFR
jgi:hypothetical protein